MTRLKMRTFGRIRLFLWPLVAIVLLSGVGASYSPPLKPLSCMSYLEDDRSLQDDYDSSSGEDEYMLRERINKKSSYENLNSNYLDYQMQILPLPTARATSDMPYETSTSTPTTTTARAASTVAPPQPRVCSPDHSFCFSIWRQTANGSQIEKQGCWKQNVERSETCNQRECVSSAPTAHNNSLYYCCCSGDFCNKRPAIKEPAVLQVSKVMYPGRSLTVPKEKGAYEKLLSSVELVLLGMLVGVCAVYACNRVYRRKASSEQAPLAPAGPGYSSNMRNVDNISLVSLLGSGKFGTVMKGILNEEEVAVKIFPEMHYHNYLNERNIYSLPMMDCPALLTYFGYDERETIDGRREYLLVLSLAPLGCLQDFLASNVLDFRMFCDMSRSVARGLSHLHTELSCADGKKPCIVHRDLNSRNILVKADHTCCIADFGFALKVSGSQYEYKGQVATAETRGISEAGTLRYMAPELLEGAVNLRDCESSLKQMDVYALALVLWELATRSADFYKDRHAVSPYKAPYEAEVGLHPTLDMMQTTVVVRKVRPVFPSGWGEGIAAKLVQDTCEDCWDHDAEARLTSMCVEERTIEVSTLKPRVAAHAQSTHKSVLMQKAPRQHHLGASTADSFEVVVKTHASDPKSAGDFSEPIVLPNQQIVPPVRTINAFSEGSEGSDMLPQKQRFDRNQMLGSSRQQRSLLPDNIGKNAQRVQRVGSNHSPLQAMQDLEEISPYDEVTSLNAKQMKAGNSKAASQCKSRDFEDVRVVTQEKLFHAEHGDAVVAWGQIQASSSSSTSLMLANERPKPAVDSVEKTDSRISNRRPNNLDLSPVSSGSGGWLHSQQMSSSGLSNKSLNAIHTIAEEEFSEDADNNLNMRLLRRQPQAELPDICRPCPSIPASISLPSTALNNNTFSTSHTSSNNNYTSYSNENYSAASTAKSETCLKSALRKSSALRTPNSEGDFTGQATSNQANQAQKQQQQHHQLQPQQHFKRQRSLEVFREVFSGRGSTEKLRDPSQRVKTPGDVPPSVRKVRASKTLSLYDDRMMDTTSLNLL